jgi:hypothetical protein
MKPSIPDVIERFNAYRKEHPLWGSLHIVLEDGNVSNSDVLFCRQWAADHDDTEGVALAEILMVMSKTQRKCLGWKVDRRKDGGGSNGRFAE